MTTFASQKGRVCIVTGANTGIGRVTAMEMAQAGAHVFAACRSKERAMPVVEEIRQACGHDKVEFLPLDLSDLDAVRTSAQSFLDRDLPLHVLINNAGLAGQKGETKQGFELAFGVNHLGHFLFTLMLAPTMIKSAPARIVNVASRAHYRSKGIPWQTIQKPTTTATGFPEYQDSKLANVLFNAELARRLKNTNVTTYALHPGVVASDIWRKVPWPFRGIAKRFMITNEEGAQTSLYCATSPQEADNTGLYYDNSKQKVASDLGRDPQRAKTLWDKSLAWTQAPDLQAP